MSLRESSLSRFVCQAEDGIRDFCLSRGLGGLFELLIGALLGVVGVIAVTIMLDILSEEEWMHLPFGDKVYRMKKGRK